jgi:pyruvate/2-oxoglutarate dehydrogenase complex dihydrolipoamide dehydrogenase (E3) component
VPFQECWSSLQRNTENVSSTNWPGSVDGRCASSAEGWGEFVDPHTVKISLTAGGEKSVTAQSILIATGGRAVKAPIEGSVRPLPSTATLN